ncbi:MAG: DUF3105 domain-containing protein [Chloroflexota bacterium]|nr:DUF3105 domain-containing protein [Chloroflexota bacterium]
MATELRRERREKQKRERQRQPHRRRGSGGITNKLVMGGFVIGAIVLAFLGLRAAGLFEPPPAAIDLNSAAFQVPAGTTIGTLQPLQAPEHIPFGQKGSYNTTPPTSGQHYNQLGVAPAPWGIKDSTLQNEITTHNLEHGGVVIGYNNLTPAETDQLKSIVRALMNGSYRKIILEPYPLTDAKVALTSWGWLLKLQSVDQIQIVQFTRTHSSDPNYAPEWNSQ